jgi:hypothetical protein
MPSPSPPFDTRADTTVATDDGHAPVRFNVAPGRLAAAICGRSRVAAIWTYR